MTTLIQIIHILICILLIGIILIQSGKGQGLAGAFGSFAGGTAQNLFGARTTDVLTKTTAWLALIFFCTAFVLSFIQFRDSKSVLSDMKKSAIEKNVSTVPTKTAEDIGKKVDDLTKKLLSSKSEDNAASEDNAVSEDKAAEPVPQAQQTTEPEVK